MDSGKPTIFKHKTSSFPSKLQECWKTECHVANSNETAVVGVAASTKSKKSATFLEKNEGGAVVVVVVVVGVGVGVEGDEFL